MSTTEQNRPVATSQPRLARMLIDGAWVDSASGDVLPVENPARRTAIASIPRGAKQDVDRAVAAAQKAFPAWSKIPPRQRGRLLLRIAEAMEARIEELARIIAEETGNALRTQARPEATLTADIFRYFGGLAGELKGETIPLGEHVLSYTRREPLGVVGAIIPWNAPVLLGALKIAPALCAGNTMVLKAAEDAPLGVLLMAEICQEFLPPGRAERADRSGRGMRRPAGAKPGDPETVLHRFHRGRQDHHARRRRTDRSGFAGTRRQKPVDRLSRCGRGLGGGRRDRRHALHPAKPVLHGGLATVPASGHFRQLPGQADGQDTGPETRRSAGRSQRHRQHHQREAISKSLRLR